MTLDEIKAFVNDLMEQGLLPDLSASQERSKYIDFRLAYKHPTPNILEPMLAQLCQEIEQYEVKVAQDDGRRSNCRSKASQQGFERSVRALVLNVLYAQQLAPDTLNIGISLDGNTYGQNKRYAPRGVSYRQLKAAYEGMEKLGYIKIYRKGFNAPSGDAQRTRIQGGASLYTLLEEYDALADIAFFRSKSDEPEECILLRDKDKRMMDYVENDFTETARHNLSLINAALRQTDIELPLNDELRGQLQQKLELQSAFDPEQHSGFVDYSSVELWRIFNQGSFEKGGRFYGGWWMSLPKKFRPLITLNGHPTVEVDFKALHPTMLYTRAGLPIPERDPYEIHPAIKRSFGKIAFNALLNAGGVPTSIPRDYDEEATGIRWRAVLEMMILHHEPVAEYFKQGIGISLQRTDSDIAERVLLHFAAKNIPCLPVHDSFIVPTHHQAELEEVMKREFRNECGEEIELNATQLTLNSSPTGAP
jgi:hypothetical protein